jgi:urease accessory protein
MRPSTTLGTGRRFAVVLASALVVWTASASPAFAHTGRPMGGAGDGLLHPLTGVDHLLAMLAVGVIAASTRDRRVACATPLAFVTGMLAGGALGVVGVPLEVSEVAIAGSVVILGGLIVTATDAKGWSLPLLALAFGAAHGHAHAAALPDGAAPVAYAIGFIGATVALHLSGIGLGFGLRRLPTLRVAAGTAIGATGLALLLAV